MTALTLILVPIVYTQPRAEPKLLVAEASIRPKLKIAASFVHYLW